MRQILVRCEGCGAEVQKPAKEVRRQLKRNSSARFFCSTVCYAVQSGRDNLGALLGVGRPENLDPANQRDEYSPFRYFLRKARSRRQEDDLDLDYLAQLWRDQGGRCALSGIALDLPRSSGAWERHTGDPWKPSLDRVDSRRGYVRGNVRFVAVIANQAKGRYSDQDVIALARSIVRLHGMGDASG